MSTDSNQEQTLFSQALEIQDPEERSRFLEEACSGQPELRRRIEHLLELEERSRDSLDSPFSDLNSPQATGLLPVSEGPGTMIGRYKLLEQIGEGGMGVVYMADQQEPVHRRVAFKIIKLGMDTKQVVARFEAERQALALMDHPHIARVLDGGATETGRPYFVMDLVRGIPITEYCDKQRLTTRERLELFIPVCQAVQHAHQKGIIHRDLKPSNVMVTLSDGVPHPMVIDFGVAKATNQKLTEQTLFTNFGQMIGTPAYMAPEQAEMSRLDVDTRSDIYSLGVLLYELLTGSQPFPEQELRGASWVEMQRIIAEKDPPKPSTRLSTLTAEQRTDLANRHQESPHDIGVLLRGDLDWIVMKCLEKDRRRRYETANGLAMDIRRHLNNEPVAARPPSRLYEFQKTVRRHKVGFASGGAVVVVLVIGLMVSMLALAREKAARERAVVAEQKESGLREQADRARETAEEERARAEGLLYASDMHLALQALREDNFRRATTLLARHWNGASRSDRLGWEWRYLWQYCLSDELFTLGRHSNVIHCVAISPDATRVASGSYDDTLSLWDVSARRLIKSAKPGSTYCVAFSSDGERLAAGGARALTLWDGRSLMPQLRIEHTNGLIRALAFSPDGRRLAYLCTGGTVHIRDLVTGHENTNFKVGLLKGSLRGALAYSPNGRMLAVGDNDGVIHLIDDEGHKRATLRSHSASITALAFSPDSRVLASSSWDGTAKLWSVASGEVLQNFDRHTRWVSAVAFSPDGRELATAGADQWIRVWDAATAVERSRLRGHKGEIWALAFSPDGRFLASGGKDGAVKIWPVRAEPPLFDPSELPPRVEQLALSPDGQTFALLATNGTVTVADLESGRVRWKVSGGAEALCAVCFAPRQPVLAAGQSNGGIRLWNLKLQRELSLLEGHSSRIRVLRFTSDGRDLWSIDDSGFYRVWRLADSVPLAKGRLSENWDPRSKTRFDCFPDKEEIAFSVEESMFVINLGMPNEVMAFNRYNEPVTCVAFAAGGQRLAIGCEDGTAHIWDCDAGREVAVLQSHRLGVHFVAFAPDGQRVATRGGDGKLRLWDLSTGQEVLTLQPVSASEESYAIHQVGFSGDGNVLWTIGQDGRWKLWRAPSLEEIAAADMTEFGNRR